MSAHISPLQLTHTKAAEIEEYLRKLSDVNGRMGACLSGTADSRSHMLTRHRDILHDYSQVGFCVSRERSQAMAVILCDVLKRSELSGRQRLGFEKFILCCVYRSSVGSAPRWERRATARNCLAAARSPPPSR